MKKNALCFSNLYSTDDWQSFEIEGNIGKSLELCSNLMIYKNLILTLAYKGETLIVAAMSLDSFGISAPKSAEEERISSLFLKNSGSDITFKVENKFIPAHKQVLAKKSRYFADLFSNAKSSRKIFEIEDCEYDVFKKFLQWIYQGSVNVDDVDGIFKLYSLAGKYLIEQLQEECLSYLIHNIDQEDVYKIFDFAHEKNICKMKKWCLRFFEKNLSVSNIADLIESLERQENSEFNRKLRKVALNFVLDSLFELYECGRENNTQIYTDFLLKNIDMETLPAFAKGISDYLKSQRKLKSQSELNN